MNTNMASRKSSGSLFVLTLSSIFFISTLVSKPLEISYGADEDRNELGKMEDRYSVLTKKDFALFGVYDGHSGFKAAEYAKESLLKNIYNEIPLIRGRHDETKIREAIKRGFQKTQNMIYSKLLKEAQEQSAIERKKELTRDSLEGAGAGTTAVVAIIDKEARKLYIANVGDSRAILAKLDWEGTFQQPRFMTTEAFVRPLYKVDAEALSVDQNVYNVSERNRIRSAVRDLAKSNPQFQACQKIAKAPIIFLDNRVNLFIPRPEEGIPIPEEFPKSAAGFRGGLAVTRSLGDLPFKYFVPGLLIADPEITVKEIAPTRRSAYFFLILASDGVFDSFSAGFKISNPTFDTRFQECRTQLGRVALRLCNIEGSIITKKAIPEITGPIAERDRLRKQRHDLYVERNRLDKVIDKQIIPEIVGYVNEYIWSICSGKCEPGMKNQGSTFNQAAIALLDFAKSKHPGLDNLAAVIIGFQQPYDKEEV